MIFYFVLLLLNITAFILLGTSFLSGPSFGGEGAVSMSETEVFVRHNLYAMIVSIVFSALASILGYLFRKSVNITIRSLKRIFIGEFVFYLLVFFVVYGYIYLIA